ncbi:MAG: methoxymalonate biosynthesis acyl carrier protein [Cyclobacteriaceae bacterium]|jgi:methoxymalonate biosynthesis acyl carrier protein
MEETKKLKDEQKSVIRNFIVKASGLSDFDNEENIFESGLVNSLFSIQLVTFLESTFVIKITMDDLDFKNFESVDKISEFIVRKKKLENA